MCDSSPFPLCSATQIHRCRHANLDGWFIQAWDFAKQVFKSPRGTGLITSWVIIIPCVIHKMEVIIPKSKVCVHIKLSKIQKVLYIERLKYERDLIRDKYLQFHCLFLWSHQSLTLERKHKRDGEPVEIGSVSNPVGSPYFYLHLPFQWPLTRPLSSIHRSLYPCLRSQYCLVGRVSSGSDGESRSH